MGGARRIPRARTSSPGVLAHPALAGGSGCGPTLANLREEAPLARALAGALAGLAALETEGAPLPSADAWTLDPEGLPHTAPREAGPAAAGLGDHVARFAALFGARPSKAGGASVLPRRHPHSAPLGAWFGRWASRGGGAREALVDLLELLGNEGCLPALPAPWGVSARWQPPPELGEPGLTRLGAGGPHRLAALRAWCVARGVRWVAPAQVPPYPYASLEPLVRAALGGREPESERWLADRIASPQRLAQDLAALLRAASRGWLLSPPAAPDEASLAVLEAAASRLEEPLLLVEAGGPPAGALGVLRVLTLPEPGERWWLQESREVLGGDEAVLQALAHPGAPLPRPGGTLLPEVPPERRLTEAPALPGGGAGWAARAWRHAAHREAAGDLPGAALWRARAHLATGQAALALPELAAGRATDPAEASLLEAKARERLLDFAGMRAALLAVGPGATPSAAPAEVHFLLGLSAWFCGQAEEGLRLMERARAGAEDPDTLVLALTGLATLRLHLGDLEAAGELLLEAQPSLARCRRPLPPLIWHQRQGLCHGKGGRYLEAAASFARAVDLAREAWDHRFEAFAELDRGNALRLAYRSGEAREHLRRAEEGMGALGLEPPRERARFDRMVCEVESGRLLEAQTSLEASLPRCPPGRERAVERYWAARILELRGEPAPALALVEAALVEVRRFADPALQAPLLNLRARLLLETRDYGRLGAALRECRRVLQCAPDPDDRLEAASVLLEASADRRARCARPDAEGVSQTLRAALPAARCRWALARVRGGDSPPPPTLAEALALARAVSDPALEAEVLAEMDARGLRPDLGAEAEDRLLRFLSENQVRGPSRRLLASLRSRPEPPAPEKPEAPSPMALLEGALEGRSDLGAAVRAAGAEAAVIARPGCPPEFSGALPPGLREALLDHALRAPPGPRAPAGISAFEGRGGLRTAFAWGDADAAREGTSFARLFAALLPPAPPPETEAPGNERVDPVLERLLLGRSGAVAALRRALGGAAQFSFPVLLTGEPGVGKEVCARALHEASPRTRRPWVPANCANLSPTLAASLLFGHRRGAFTGADRDSPGLVETARGGTLFLDEVGELPQETQAQLLRFLQDGGYTPLGEGRPRCAEVRVVAATNRDLESAVRAGAFRADLFHRLNVIRLEVPPLRARPEDVPLLFGHFLSDAARSEGRAVPAVDDEVWGHLLSWSWPGNVRELQNLARSLLVACSVRGRILPGDLPPHLASGAAPAGATGGLRAARERAERAAVEEALRRCSGNVSAAARALGITRQALARRIGRGGPGGGSPPETTAPPGGRWRP